MSKDAFMLLCLVALDNAVDAVLVARGNESIHSNNNVNMLTSIYVQYYRSFAALIYYKKHHAALKNHQILDAKSIF